MKMMIGKKHSEIMDSMKPSANTNIYDRHEHGKFRRISLFLMEKLCQLLELFLRNVENSPILFLLKSKQSGQS